MGEKHPILLGIAFYFFFLVLTPLGIFNDWIPPITQKGFYSITQIDRGDDTGYYVYLRSAFFDGDWDFINERNYAHIENFSPTGYVLNNWQIGQSILFLPFFLVGHLAAIIYNALGYPVSVDGYSAPYYMATAVASQTYLFTGLLLLFHLLKKSFANSIALISTLAIWLGSPLVYYTFIRQRMAHTAEFFLAVVFIIVWLKERESEKYLKHAIIGSILGLLCMVRILDISFLILYWVDQLLLIGSKEKYSLSLKAKALLFRTASLGVILIIILLPQILTWNQLNGIPLPSRHVEFASLGLTSFSPLPLLEKLFTMFFGAQWGLVYSAPLIIFGLIGVLIGNSFPTGLRASFIVYLCSFFLIIVLYPEDSASYGHRHLIPTLPILVLGLVRVFNWFNGNHLWHRALIIFFILSIVIQYIMLNQYKVTMEHDDPEFTLKALATVPSLIFDQPQLLLRSTNSVRLFFIDHAEAWNYKDFMFLIIFPMSQFVSLGLVYFSYYWIKKNKNKIPKVHSKYFLSFWIIFSISLNIIILKLMPLKLTEEINTRKKYIEVMKEGDLAFGKKEYNRSMDLYLKAGALIPDLPIPNFKVALAMDKEKNFEKANKYYKKVLYEYPENDSVHYNLGINLSVLGQFQEAEKHLKAAIRIAPGNKKIYNSLGKVYAKKNEAEKAKILFQTALTIDPNYAEAHANLALLLTIMKKPKEAIIHLKEAIRLNFDDPLITRLSEYYKKIKREDGN